MLTYVDYTASNGQVNFTIPFQYLERDHVHVYIDGVETEDWSFNGNTTAQLDDACAGGEVVRVRRITPYNEPVVDYSNGSVLNESDLDAGVLQNLFVLQEAHENPDEEASSNHTLDSHTDGQVGQSTAKGTMRVYDAGGKWAAVDAPATGAVLIGDTVVPEGVRFLAKGTDGYVLSVSDNADGKLAWIPGFKNLLTAVGDILYASAIGVVSRLALGTKNQVLTAVPGSGPAWKSMWETGDAKVTWRRTASAGWIKLDDGSIGPTGSAATTRANDDTEDLYKLIWDNPDIADADAPVAGGRGASANADWLAGKLMTLPKQLGRFLLIAGSGSGLTTRALGDTGGQENWELLQHNHNITDPGHAHNITALTSGSGGGATLDRTGDKTNDLAVIEVADSNTTGITIDNAGSASGTDKNLPPWGAWNIMVKL